MPRPRNWTIIEAALFDYCEAQNMTSHEISEHFKRRGYDRTPGSLNAFRQRIRTSIGPIPSELQYIVETGEIAQERPFSPPNATANRDIDSIIKARLEEFKLKRGHHEEKREGREIHLPDGKPFAITLFGDPHLDDAGTCLETLMKDMALVRDTAGCYGVNMGDLTNNWCPPLARLYGVQQTTADEAVTLIRWMLDQLPWLTVILGNHDKWSKDAEMACKEKGVNYVSHGAKFRIHAGEKVLKMDLRHTHRGHSMYNPAHGQLKQNYRGSDCHVIAGAHTHTGAYTMVCNGVARQIGHALRIGSYKLFDEYADANGFDQDSIGPACMIVVDTRKEEYDPGFVKVFWDLNDGAEYLGLIR